MLSSKAAEAGSAVWAEVCIQAPVVGTALLHDAQYLAVLAADMAQDGLAVLSGKPMDFGTLQVHFDHGSMPQFTDISLSVDADMAHDDFNDDDDFFASAQDIMPIELDQSGAFDDMPIDCAQSGYFEAWSMHANLSHSVTVSAY
ncbi:hypothetical protein D3C71_1557630 [compost metagenome]